MGARSLAVMVLLMASVADTCAETVVLLRGKAAFDAITKDRATENAQLPLFNKAKSDYDGAAQKAVIGAAIFGAAWAYGILDVSLGSAPLPEGLSFNVVPERIPGGSVAGRLAYSIPFGGARH